MAVLALTAAVLVSQIVQLVWLRSFAPAGVGGAGSASGDLADVLRMVVMFFLVGLIGWAQLIVGIIWMYRASNNVTLAGIKDRTWGPGWAVGAWFIPVANVVLGFFVVREIWRGSQPGANDSNWKQIPVPAWIMVWWAAWAGSMLISYGSAVYSMVVSMAQTFREPLEPAQPPDVFVMSAVAGALYLVAGVFFLRFVRAIQGLQDDRHGMMPALPQAL